MRLAHLPIAILIAAQGIIAHPVRAQQLNLDEYPKAGLADLPQRYRVWVDQEVRWIITDDERDVFLRLSTDTQRDLFIRSFWKQRDPSPGTERNEYRELHYQRFRYAEKTFGRDSPSPGWATDRGRIWILLGRPRSINRLPNTSQAVPVEIWFYNVDPALRVPPFFYLIFFRDRGVGSYRLWSPTMDGPRRLLNPSAEQALARGGGGLGPGGSLGGGTTLRGRAVSLLRQVDAELANAATSLVPGEGGIDGVSSLRSEIVITRVLDLPNRLMPDATWAYNVLTGAAESKVRFETLPMESEVVALLDLSGEPFLHTVTRTRGNRLNLDDYDGRYYVTFSYSSSVRDDALRFLQAGDPVTLQADLDEETARKLRSGPVQYMDRSPAVSGDYTVDIVLENNVTREYGRREHRVHVPSADAGSVDSSDPFLVLESNEISADRYDPFADHYPFQVGRRFLVPALSGPFPVGATAHVFWQIYAPHSRRVPIEMTLSLVDASKNLLIRKQIRVPLPAEDGHGIIDQLVDLDLTGVAPGAYELECDLDADDRQPVRLRLVVEAAQTYVRPFVHAPRKPPAAAAQVRLTRARELRTLGRTEEAIREVAAVLEREPGQREALQMQLDLLTDAGRFEEVAELLQPALVTTPNDTALLLRMADVRARLADHYDAIRFYERALLAGAAETPELLNALASEYYAEDRTDRVIELLRRSLQLRPEQPQIESLLQKLRASESGQGEKR